MNNLTGLLNKNKILILLLMNKQTKINNELQTAQKKYKLLQQKNMLLQKNIDLLQQKQKKYQKLKNTVSIENTNNTFLNILPFFFIKIPVMNMFFILLFMISMIDNYYKENSKKLDGRIKNITSELKIKKTEIDKIKKEILNTSKNVKRLQKLLKENKEEQSFCYFSSRYILTLYNNTNSEKKLIKNN